MTTNTGYFMLWALREARRAIKAAERGDRRSGLIHLSRAWRFIGTATAGGDRHRPGYLSRQAYWTRMSRIEQVADRAANDLADLCMFAAATAGARHGSEA